MTPTILAIAGVTIAGIVLFFGNNIVFRFREWWNSDSNEEPSQQPQPPDPRIAELEAERDGADLTYKRIDDELNAFRTKYNPDSNQTDFGVRDAARNVVNHVAKLADTLPNTCKGDALANLAHIDRFGEHHIIKYVHQQAEAAQTGMNQSRVRAADAYNTRIQRIKDGLA